MPWENPAIQPIIQQLHNLIKREFNLEVSAPFLICSINELKQACLLELEERNLQERLLVKERQRLDFIYGKYFKESHEIWLVEDKGDVLDVMLHEALHSIQVCHIDREDIVDYITFKLTNDRLWIDDYTLENWLEIEESNGFSGIKKRFLTEGDCED